LAHVTCDSCTANDFHRNTPLILAAAYGHVAVVRVLLEGGADVQRFNDDKRTALHTAAYNGHLEVCRLLLDWGANVDTEYKGKYTALHDAAFSGHLLVVQLLVERGAGVGLKSHNGLTAADWARRAEYTAVADWLDSVNRV
jgi:ankyrin repeat protein